MEQSEIASPELAPALVENVFYHVALADSLPLAAREGLRPGSETGQDNFPDFVGSDRDCVYLWPNVMAAWSWSREGKERFLGVERVLLRVSGLDLARLSPDNEEFGRFLQEPEGFIDGLELYAEMCARGLWDDERNEALAKYWSNYDASGTRELLRTLPQDLLLLLASSFAETGEALMHRGPIPPALVEVAELNDEERLREEFDADYPSPWQGEHEPSEQEEEDYYTALDSFLAGRECVTVELMEQRLESLEEWPENAEERFFSFAPLSELELAQAPARPSLADLGEAPGAAHDSQSVPELAR